MPQKFRAAPEPVEGFLVHIHAHSAWVVVEHGGQVSGAVDG